MNDEIFPPVTADTIKLTNEATTPTGPVKSDKPAITANAPLSIAVLSIEASQTVIISERHFSHKNSNAIFSSTSFSSSIKNFLYSSYFSICSFSSSSS